MKIEGLTHQGLGRATDGTLLPRTLPGEEVEVSGDIVRIITPSTDRVAPPCAHYKSCGGCAMQHASDPFVAAWKQDVVRRALGAHGITAHIAGMETSPPSSRRRAKLSGRRTKKGALVGFHARASDTIIPIPGCILLRPALIAVLPALEEATLIAASRKAEVGLTVTETLNGVDLRIDTDKPLTAQLRVELAGYAQRHRLARLVWNDEQVVVLAPPDQRFGPARVTTPPGAFLQATADGETALLAAVRGIVGAAPKVIDLFAGCGTFSLPLVERAEVHAVEGQSDMIAAMDRGWRETAGLKRLTTEVRDLFRRPLEPDELRRFDAAVIDPPRAGAEAQVTRIAQARVPVVAMVSCNPVTFARDAQTLIRAGYGMGPIRVVDQFRWSSHLELVAGFTLS